MIRVVAAAMSESLRQQVVVENHLGAGGLAAASTAAKAASDGHTWLAADNGLLVFNAAIYKSLPYDKSSFSTIGLMARAPLLLVASPQAGLKNAKDMLDTAKANPKQLNYASAGMGSPSQLAMELLAKRTGLQFVRVPFGSDVAALNDVVAGQIAMTVADLPSALPHIRAGKLQVLATFTPRRLPNLADAPTMAELGQPDMNVYLWQGLAVHAKTAPDIQAKISQSLQAAVAQASVRKRLSDAGWEILASEPGFAQAYVGAETINWYRVIKEAGIRAD
jgi:tripartite-type tricarboxylate transporter receptor subunit TctC